MHTRAGGPSSSTIGHGSHQLEDVTKRHQLLGIMLEVVRIARECTYVQGELKDRK
jgi:hypothetical protein